MFNKFNKKIISTCIAYPIFTLALSLFTTALILGGLRHVKQDDDMINLLPKEIGSRKAFEEIQNEYGLTEYMYVAIGNKNHNIINPTDLGVIWDITHELESLKEVDKVISLSTTDKISLDPADSSIVIEDLMITRNIEPMLLIL